MPTVSVANLQKSCSLRVRNLDSTGWAASDNCGHLASTAVHMSKMHIQWRCGAHEGIVSAVFGEVVREIEVKEEV
jgi:hypothetical protein